MKVEVLSRAVEDLLAGFRFYEEQSAGLGRRFSDTLHSEIDLLRETGGIHPLIFGYHRALSQRFPYAIYYLVEGQVERVHAVLDCRRDPSWIRQRLG